MRRSLPLFAFLLAPWLAPAAAMAHTDLGAHGTPLEAGFLHPFLGADHMLAMVAVGLLAATTGGRAIVAYPASFLGAMVVGGVLGFEGAALPVIEPAILASIIVLGAAIVCALRPPLLLACGVIGLFGMAHGYAHGLEGPALGGLPYALGFAVATAILHAVGLGLGFAGATLGRPALARTLGALTAAGGLFLAFA